MDVTRERISRILELREILMSFQTGFNLANAAVICAILDSISSSEPLSGATEPKYLKLVTVLSFFTLISLLMLLVFCHQSDLLSTDLHAVGYGGFVQMLN